MQVDEQLVVLVVLGAVVPVDLLVLAEVLLHDVVHDVLLEGLVADDVLLVDLGALEVLLVVVALAPAAAPVSSSQHSSALLLFSVNVWLSLKLSSNCRLGSVLPLRDERARPDPAADRATTEFSLSKKKLKQPKLTVAHTSESKTTECGAVLCGEERGAAERRAGTTTGRRTSASARPSTRPSRRRSTRRTSPRASRRASTNASTGTIWNSCYVVTTDRVEGEGEEEWGKPILPPPPPLFLAGGGGMGAKG